MGLGLIALLVTAIGEYVEGLRQEALRKTQKLIDDAAKLAEQAKGEARAGPTYQVESQRTHNQKKTGGARFGKMGVVSKRAKREMSKTGTSADNPSKYGPDKSQQRQHRQEATNGNNEAKSAGGVRQGGKMEP